MNERTADRTPGPGLLSSMEERDKDGLIRAVFIRGLLSDSFKLSETKKTTHTCTPIEISPCTCMSRV